MKMMFWSDGGATSSCRKTRPLKTNLCNIVGELLQKIPEDQRLTFMMHHYSGLSLPEVADAMESNLPTTKSRLRFAGKN